MAALDDVLDETEAALGEAAVAQRDGVLLLRVRRGDCILVGCDGDPSQPGQRSDD